MYVVKYDPKQGKFALLGVPDELEVELINEFTFLMNYKGQGFTVNVHSNSNKYMVLKDYNSDDNYRKKFKR